MIASNATLSVDATMGELCADVRLYRALDKSAKELEGQKDELRKRILGRMSAAGLDTLTVMPDGIKAVVAEVAAFHGSKTRADEYMQKAHPAELPLLAKFCDAVFKLSKSVRLTIK